MDETKLLNEIIDKILTSEFAKEFEEDKVGKDEYYFSIHSKNLDIINQFPFDSDFIKDNPELKEYLISNFRDFIENDILGDAEIFLSWFEGDSRRIYFEGYINELIEDLLGEYILRITKTYKCEDCGKEISENFPCRHPNHLHRIGTKKKTEKKYKNNLYCRACFDKRSKAKIQNCWKS